MPPKRKIEHPIKLKGFMPKPTQLYLLIPKEDKELQELLKEALANGLILPLVFSYGAPFFFVTNKNGTLWMVNNYFSLNAATVKNKYSLQVIRQPL